MEPQPLGAPVIHITEGLGLDRGGTTQFVTTLCEGLGKSGFRVEVWAPRAAGDGASLPGVDYKVRLLDLAGPAALRRCPNLYAMFEQSAPKPAVIHQHGLWLDLYRTDGRFARQHNVPLVISVHGMLEPWAMQRSRWKKKLAWTAFQKRQLQSAACLHVATEREARNIRNLGIRSPIAVIPNAIRLEHDRVHVAPPSPADKQTILFLGRIHPVKGLEFFLRVWAKVALDFRNWQVVIAGPEENAHQAELISLANRLGISDSVCFPGAVTGQRKAELIDQCQFLILPSHMESFGIVVLEALAAGKPAMVSKHCPWADLEKFHCGWWLERDESLWEQTLVEAMLSGRNERREMGARGKRLVQQKYSVDRLVESMKELYHWTVTGATPDSFNFFD